MTTATRFPVEGAHMTDRARRLDEPQWLHRHLRAVVLLAGSIRPSEMFRAVGCSPLHLPVDQTHTLIHWWHDQIEALVERLGLARIVTKVMVDRQSRPPTTANLNGRVLTSVKTDPSEYRGTASLLKDVADTYADDDLLLVASAFQLLTQPLADLTIQITGLPDRHPGPGIACASLQKPPAWKCGFPIPAKNRRLSDASRSISDLPRERFG